MVLKRVDFSTTPPSYVDVATNDDWGTNPNVAELITRSGELGAFGLVDGSGDAALLVELEPGQYSVIADDPAQIHLFKTMIEFWKRNLGAGPTD